MGMSDAKHTPTPWLAYHAPGAAEIGLNAAEGRIIGGIYDMAWRENRKGVSEVTHANAAYIVRAVNAHEALVAMVRELRGLVRVTGPMTTARERADELLASLE
jgi:hypothetical protein